MPTEKILDLPKPCQFILDIKSYKSLPWIWVGPGYGARFYDRQGNFIGPQSLGLTIESAVEGAKLSLAKYLAESGR